MSEELDANGIPVIRGIPILADFQPPPTVPVVETPPETPPTAP